MLSGLSMTLWGLANCIIELRQAAAKIKDEYAKSAANAAEIKLKTLYKEAAMSKPVIVATAVDPRYKMEFFSWAVKKNITGMESDTEVKTHAWRIVKDTFTEYWRKQGGKATMVTRDRGGELISRRLRSTAGHIPYHRRIPQRAVNFWNIHQRGERWISRPSMIAYIHIGVGTRSRCQRGVR
jgi:hypothetical protein